MSEPKYLSVRCDVCDGSGHQSIVNWLWLRQTRTAAKVSLREMARRMKFSAAYVSDVERGRRTATVTFLRAYEALIKE